MNSNYERILQDLSYEQLEDVEIYPPPYNENMDEKAKISIVYQCLLRALRVKQRKKSLIYAYYLGQLIESGMQRKKVKQIITDHYYLTSIRIYYIFEFNPMQIESTKEMTVSMVRQLSSKEFKTLVIEL